MQAPSDILYFYRAADKFLARPGRKQHRKHVRDARDFNNIETRAVIVFLFRHGKEPKEIHAILTEILACFLSVRAKDLSAPCTRVGHKSSCKFMPRRRNQYCYSPIQLNHHALLVYTSPIGHSAV